jgi:hypothetical protein
MKTKMLILVTTLVVSLSFAASAIIIPINISGGNGTVGFGGIFEANFNNFTIDGGLNGTLLLEVYLVEAPELSNGDVIYTDFIHLGITNPVHTFGTVDASLMILPSLSTYLGEGDSINIYRNGEVWTTVQIDDTGDGLYATVTGITEFSIWGGGGDDPTIPDPATASIIGCGLLLMARKLKR